MRERVMAQVRVDREALRTGELPRVCVVTGEPAHGTVTFRSHRLPSWAWLLLLVGIVPFLIALALAGERVEGHVPVVREVVRRFHRRRRLATSVTLIGLVGLVVAVLSRGPGSLWPFVGVVVAGIVLALRAEFGFIHGRALRDGRTVVLSRVHPAFVQAVRRSVAAPRA